MKTKYLKITALLSSIIILLVGYSFNTAEEINPLKSFKYKTATQEKENIKDSILVFRSDNFEILKMDLSKKYLIDTVLTTASTSYHKINFDTKTITSIQFNNENNRWESYDIQYTDISKEEWGTVFKTKKESCPEISIRKDSAIIYHLITDETYTYLNLKKVDNKVLELLKIYDVTNWKTKNTKSQTTQIQHPNNDFEYSDYWRKEAYKATKKFMVQRLKKDQPDCTIIGQGVYNPYLVQYLGWQGYLVKILCTYDCNNDYTNEAYFWVEAHYLGNNHWDMALIEQKYKD